jgi:hypothetical protein
MTLNYVTKELPSLAGEVINAAGMYFISISKFFSFPFPFPFPKSKIRYFNFLSM